MQRNDNHASTRASLKTSMGKEADDLTAAWPNACKTLQKLLDDGGDYLFTSLSDLVERGNFPTLEKQSKSLVMINSTALMPCKHVFNNLLIYLAGLFNDQLDRANAAHLCDLICTMCHGNMYLLQKSTFILLLRSMLSHLKSLDISKTHAHLRQAFSSALAALLYLHPVDYKASTSVANAGTQKKSCSGTALTNTKYPDLLFPDKELFNSLLEAIVSILEEHNLSREDDCAIELSCLHALVQLICHRKVGCTAGFSGLDRPSAAKAITAVWPSIYIPMLPLQSSGKATSRFGETSSTSDHCYSGGDSTGSTTPSLNPFKRISAPVLSSDAGSESEDGSRSRPICSSFVAGGLNEGQMSRNIKKIRLLATFCLRRLLTVTSKRVCLDIWPNLMPEPQPVATVISSIPLAQLSLTSAGKKSSRVFQPDFITVILKERDLRLRQIFIEIFRGLLGNMEPRFAIAEELSSWHSAAFLPYSVRLAAELRTLHRRLSWALLSERNGNHQLILMKAINSLTLVTPYHRLRPGLLTTLLSTLNRFLLHQHEEHVKTPHFQSAILGIWSTLLSKSSTPVLEICQLLSQPPIDVTAMSVPKNTNFQRKSTTEIMQKQSSEEQMNKPSPPTSNPLQHFTSPSSRQYSGTFSSCWLVDFCLRLIHPDVAVLAWDKLEQSSPLYCISTDLQPNTLRMQALSTLTHFISNYFECLRPSMPLLIRTIRLCLQPGVEENRPLRTNLLRLCNGLLSRLIETANTSGNSFLDEYEKSEEVAVNLRRNVSWWIDTMDLILSNLQVDSEASECWWSCQVLGVFFELQSLDEVNVNASILYKRTTSLLFDLCTQRHDGVQAKALRTLFSLAILDNCSVSRSLVSDCIQLSISLADNASFFLSSEIAYCIEMCTIRVLCKPEAFDIAWDGKMLMKMCLRLCSSSLNEANFKQIDSIKSHELQVEGCRNSDARRCEHAVHSISNVLELMSSGFLSMVDSTTINEVFKVLTSSLEVTAVNGSEKIRWNAALAATKILKNEVLTNMIASNVGDKSCELNINNYVVAPLINALCHGLVEDRYFKVRAHASLALLMLFKNTLDGTMDEEMFHPSAIFKKIIMPVVIFSEPIVKAVVNFLSTDFTTDNDDHQPRSKEAEQHYTVCMYTSIMLLLHSAITSLMAISNNYCSLVAYRNLHVIAESITISQVSSNLKIALNLAADTSTAALSVVKITKSASPGVKNLLDFPSKQSTKQTKVSFFERYSVLEGLEFTASVQALLKAVKIFDDLLSEILDLGNTSLSDIRKNLTKLPNLLRNCLFLSSVIGSQIDQNAAQMQNELSTFRTVYD